MPDPRCVVVYTAPVGRSVEWDGRHIYERQGEDPTVLGNPCSFTGLASALRGDYRTVDRAPPESLASYDVVLVVGKLEFAVEWLHAVRTRWPGKVLVGQFEENVRKHKIWCRSWPFQRDFHAFAQLVDVLTTFTDGTQGYYELFARGPVAYLPHPYPAAWLESLGVFRTRESKDPLLFKAGYVHGRIGTDGFADVVPLARVAARHPDLRIAVSRHPATSDEVLAETDIRERQHVRRLHSALYSGALTRALPAPLARAVRRLLLEPAPAGGAADPLLLRGVHPSRIEVLPPSPWREMLRIWGRVHVALDLDWGWTVGRNAADAAAAGTPIIGCNSDFQRVLYPELSVGELDFEGAERLVERLLADPDFYEGQVASARRALQAFDYDATRERFRRIVAPLLAARSAAS